MGQFTCSHSNCSESSLEATQRESTHQSLLEGRLCSSLWFSIDTLKSSYSLLLLHFPLPAATFSSSASLGDIPLTAVTQSVLSSFAFPLSTFPSIPLASTLSLLSRPRPLCSAVSSSCWSDTVGSSLKETPVPFRSDLSSDSFRLLFCFLCQLPLPCLSSCVSCNGLLIIRNHTKTKVGTESPESRT